VASMNKEKVLQPALRFAGFGGDWTEYSLKDMAQSFEYGLNASAEKYDGIHKYLRITDINEDTREFDAGSLTTPKINLALANNCKLQYGDLLFARTGASVGKTYYYKTNDGLVYYAGFLIRARINPSYDVRFVFQNTLTYKYKQFIQVMSQRSGQPGVNANEYGQFDITTPLHEEQTQIGNFFQNIDKQLTLHQAKHRKIQQSKKAMLGKMFPKTGAKVPEVRFTGFSGDWEVEPLGLNASFNKGKGYSKGDLKTFGSPIVLYGRLYTNYQMTITSVDTFVTPNGTGVISTGREVIVPASGETAEDIARASAVLQPNVILGGDLNVIYPNSNIRPSFLALIITYSRCQAELAKKAQGKSVVHVRNSDLKDLLVPIPAIEEQTKISEYFQNLECLIALQQQQIDKLKNIKQACLEQMFV
jgi:type I restriction enzyme S subunit